MHDLERIVSDLVALAPKIAATLARNARGSKGEVEARELIGASRVRLRATTVRTGVPLLSLRAGDPTSEGPKPKIRRIRRRR
jgi:hypothetical protein